MTAASFFLQSHSEPPDSPGSIAVAPPASALAARRPDFPLPSFYGIYAANHGDLYELEALPGRVPNQRIFMSAVMSKPSRTRFRTRDRQGGARHELHHGGKGSHSRAGRLWAIRNISYDFRVSPLSDHPEMLVIQPNDPDLILVPGRYGMVINDTGYDFTVAGKITDATQCLERVEAANGTFYSECRKP
jgi:hypothetical protein